ncbi:MAG: chromosome partitioning protein ParB [Deltaproteobacteria bacterium CG_4_10_14_0_2_um_filter_43_8]|nr:MAG: chromosome partitioning protein ParB [Deltaproteobacteria bacterium CG11_big_fil_rev_8_21_14_0_20_42_23]PJA18772.1 MAG: chromosome partitioning protein ParB [Deltaproteobacteria bacterium CG_4_10_14_0_2_um_filter_43_8]PJC63908.1 MAG: chromosome partitioning protein ParB [Deltaproteobacteria bacterium CG_4_9_14_0_2_um_filter_42_21]
MSNQNKQMTPRGMGIESLISKIEPQKTSSDKKNDGYFFLPIEKIFPLSNQPRNNIFEEGLEDLVRSIKQIGIIQPIIVNKQGQDRYEIIAGERRFRAAVLAGLEEIPVLIREEEPERHYLLSLVENLIREDLNAIEEALAYKQLMDTYKFTQEDIASETGFSRSRIANSLRLLHLPLVVQEDLMGRRYHSGHARALMALQNEEKILKYRAKLLQKYITVRELEVMVQYELEGRTQLTEEEGSAYPNWLREETSFFEREINAPVKVCPRKDGGGRLIIEYASEEDFRRITGLIKS